eukprot:209788_1
MTNIIFTKLDKISNTNELWYPLDLMTYCSFNTVYFATLGSHIFPDEPMYQQSIDVISHAFNLLEVGVMYRIFPTWLLFLTKLNPFSSYHKLSKFMKKKSEMDEQIKEHYQERKQQNGDKDAVYYADYMVKELSESQALADIGTVFAAAVDTTASTLNFAIILCAKYPEIQQKLREELMECYDQNYDSEFNKKNEKRKFQLQWVNQLMWFRAFIFEVIRVSSVVKMGTPHYANNDILVKTAPNEQICIPKGTVIMYNIELIHKNNERENWVDSSSHLCLENWINLKTNKFQKNESFMTFGAGRRSCVGQDLAVKEMYLVMTYYW